MNPFDMKPGKKADLIVNWEGLWPKPYDKRSVDPYTRTRVILMNGTEFESVWFGHQFSRSVTDNELRRQLALIRRSEQQQQKIISHMKPGDETPLEHTIGYEQLAVDLTAHLAQRVSDMGVKNALDFALLEDFDHLYRYSDYLDMTTGVKAEELVGRYTEIMPGRPTVAHHRHPYDSVRFPMTGPAKDSMNLLAANIITAAEQQTMNYYMNLAATEPDETLKKLYQEIGMIEEQHVTQYGSLLNPGMTWLENLLAHQFTECYLYWSCAETETDPCFKELWEDMFEKELMHLHIAEGLLKEYEGKEWQQVIPGGEFPAPLKLTSNIPYVRQILGNTAQNTALREEYLPVDRLPEGSTFADYQQQVNVPLDDVMSHRVIETYIAKNGKDYRFETAPNPVVELRDRTVDNTQVGRVSQKVLERV